MKAGAQLLHHGRLALAVSLRFLKARARMIALAFLGVAAPLGVFALFARDIRSGKPLEFDRPFLETAHAHASPSIDALMLLASELGYHSLVVPVDVGLLAGLLAFRKLRRGIFVAVAVAGSALLNLGAKAVFERDRPDLWLSIAPEHTFSFPSGHAMGSATLAATVVLLCAHTRWRWPVLLLGLGFMLWVGASRVYLGVHYPSDILAGWAAAVTWVCAAYLIVRPNLHHGQKGGVADSPAAHQGPETSA
jgi:membrane-associated phospholipid phosphatase